MRLSMSPRMTVTVSIGTAASLQVIIIIIIIVIIITSHASIAYRKRLPPQRTVNEQKETTGPAKRYENEQSEMPNGARAALA